VNVPLHFLGSLTKNPQVTTPLLTTSPQLPPVYPFKTIGKAQLSPQESEKTYDPGTNTEAISNKMNPLFHTPGLQVISIPSKY